MDDKTFIEKLVKDFPEIKDEILDEDNLDSTSLQIFCFRAFTQDAIDNDDIELVKRCLLFVNDVFYKVDFKIQNSLCISYLVKLRFQKGSRIEKIVPQKLQKEINDLKESYNNRPANKKVDDFIRRLKDD